MRGIAALMVVFFHYVLSVPPASFGVVGSHMIVFISDYMDLGRIGVVIFFAISGFIIPTSLNARSSSPARKFMVGRFFRLYPLYWLSILLCLAAAGVGTMPGPYVIFANLTMVQGFLLAPEINGAAWTLAIELIFYAICLGLFLCGALHSRRVQFAMLVGALALAMLLAVLRFHLMRKLPVALPLALSVMFFGTLWRGSVLDRAPDALRYARRAMACFVIVIPAVCLMAYRVDFGFHEWPLPYIVSYLGGLALFVAGTTWLRRVPRWLAHLGTISYSAYLLHTPIMMAASRLGLAPAPDLSPVLNWVSVFAVMAAVVVVSHFSYVFLEKPCVTLGRRLDGARALVRQA